MQKKILNTDCTLIRNNLFSYQEKQLSDIECKEFEDHLHSCKECSLIVSEFQSITSFIDEKKSAEPNPFTGTRIIQAIESQIEEMDAIPAPFFQKIIRPLTVSFLLLTAAFIGFSIVKPLETRYSDSLHRQNDIQAMKSELNIPEFIEEDNALFDNN